MRVVTGCPDTEEDESDDTTSRERRSPLLGRAYVHLQKIVKVVDPVVNHPAVKVCTGVAKVGFTVQGYQNWRHQGISRGEEMQNSGPNVHMKNVAADGQSKTVMFVGKDDLFQKSTTSGLLQEVLDKNIQASKNLQG